MSTPDALVIGARGAIGRFLLPRLRAMGVSVSATSRDVDALEHGDGDPGVRWQRLDLHRDEPAAARAAPDVVYSLGPLDAFAAWFACGALRPRVVVAFGSTSAASKQQSADAAERALAARLHAAEATLHAACAARGVHATVLRPTLVYGAGVDRNLSRIVALARRWRGFVLPRDACGLRQPVHADDLAQAALAVARRGAPLAAHYDLPGGETLPYDEMVRRVLACLQPPLRLWRAPARPLRVAFVLAQRLGLLRDASSATWDRLRTDLVFDPAPAERDLQWSPRRFAPDPGMFVAAETK